MDLVKVSILLNLAFWLGYYIGRNNRIPEPTIASSPRALVTSKFDWSVLEERQSICNESHDGSRGSPGHTTQSGPDISDERPASVARFSGAKVVIESQELAARRNAADINRLRREFRGVSG